MTLGESHNYSCSANFFDMEAWLQTNCTGYWSLSVIDRPNVAPPIAGQAAFVSIPEDGLLICLETAEDAMLFELRWMGSLEMKPVAGTEIAEPAFSWEDLNRDV